MSNEEVINVILVSVNDLFTLAESFGYKQYIEDIIYKHHKNKL